MTANNLDLSGLVKFLDRDDWAFHFEEVMGDHFWPVMDEFDLDQEELGEAIGDHWSITLWSCAFDDFLSQTFEPDGKTFVDAYLKRRGWKETARTKAYMKALSGSVISLYEVSEIVPGQSFLARDLLRAGEPVTVSEASATKTLLQWERIAARIVPVGDKRVIAGGLLPFSPEICEALQEGLRALSGKRRSRKSLVLDDDTLRAAAPLFTHVFLFDMLPKALGQAQLSIHNSDGDEIVFHEVRFPLAAGTTQEDIADRLENVPGLRQENAQFWWNWLGERPRSGKLKQRGPDIVTAGASMEDGTPVLGNIELKGRALVLMVNSAERAARGAVLIENVLGKMLGTPLTSIQTIDQMKEARKAQPKSADDIPLDVATPLVHAMLDRQYREILDEPVGMLGNIAPRAAIKTKQGREKVAEWLKYLELRAAGGQNPQDPMATYDFSWMWRELTVEDLRK